MSLGNQHALLQGGGDGVQGRRAGTGEGKVGNSKWGRSLPNEPLTRIFKTQEPKFRLACHFAGPVQSSGTSENLLQ